MPCNIFYVRLLIATSRMCGRHVWVRKINSTLAFVTQNLGGKGISLSSAISAAALVHPKAAGNKTIIYKEAFSSREVS